jgi:hypothetical protein
MEDETALRGPPRCAPGSGIPAKYPSQYIPDTPEKKGSIVVCAVTMDSGDSAGRSGRCQRCSRDLIH